jgi:integrase/recombinase XerC
LQGKRDYAIVALMVTAGLRDIEVVNANIEDLRTVGDFTALFLLGKGRDEKAEYVKIVEQVEDAIRNYLKELPDREPSNPLFMSLSNRSYGSRLTTRSVSRICKNALVQAGYDSSRLTAHSLRHTAVTLSLLGGKSLQEVQQFARHTNISTTQIYAHNLDRAKNDCEEVVAKAIF